MKRIIVACAIVLALLAVPAELAVPAHADASGSQNCSAGQPGTFTCTIHGFESIDLGPGCGLADTVIQGNGVFHENINQNGSWITGTVEGPAFGTDVNGNVVFTGHAQTWFGDENNLQNGVEHFTTNVSGALADGSPLGGHANGDFTINANGQVTASHVNFFCR